MTTTARRPVHGEAPRSIIPVSKPSVGPAEEQLVLEVLRSGQLAQGRYVEELEGLFATASGTRHAVAVSNGTSALFLALEALDLRPGDEVITSPLTFVATLNAIIAAGATARFADIRDDFTIDPDDLEQLINGRTRAILPVHLYGLPADMEAIEPIARRHGLAIVEDAAQAVGATVGDRRVGSYGLGCYSLYATKNVAAGEGGMITLDDDEAARWLRMMRNQGMRSRYEYERPGYNLRMTDLHAAVAIPQMLRLDDLSAARQHNATILTDGLGSEASVRTPLVPAGRTHVFHQYTLVLDADIDRAGFVDHLLEYGVGSGIYYPRLVHDHACFRDHELVVTNPTPMAQRLVRSLVSLPVHPLLSEADLDHIVTMTKKALHA